jgi:DNA-binding response OmpR family regulator
MQRIDVANGNLDFGSVNVLVYDPDQTSRKATIFALTGIGIRNIIEHFSINGLSENIEAFDADLIILDCSTAGRIIFRFVEDLRNRQIGSNPFIPVIMTVWSPTRQLVLDALQSGIDDLVMKPVSANVLTNRINTLVRRRKPFVFEESYIGPIRVRDHDELVDRAPIEVPNTLRAKATHEPEEEITQELVDSIVSFQRCKRIQIELERTVGALKEYFESNGEDEFPAGLTSNLATLGEDLGEEAYLGAFIHIVELSKALRTVGSSLHRNGAVSGKRDMQLLEHTAEAIKIGLIDRHNAIDAASAIAETIAQAQRREK